MARLDKSLGRYQMCTQFCFMVQRQTEFESAVAKTLPTLLLTGHKYDKSSQWIFLNRTQS